MTNYEPPFDGKACPMCPMKIRNLSATMHNLGTSIAPPSSSLCNIASKWHSVRSAVYGLTLPDEARPELKRLLEVALRVCDCKTYADVMDLGNEIRAASDAVRPLSDAHFADSMHAHGHSRWHSGGYIQ
jgi:hypothetical protein